MRRKRSKAWSREQTKLALERDWSPVWILQWNEDGGRYLVRRLRAGPGTNNDGELRFHVNDVSHKARGIIDALLMLLNEQASMAQHLKDIAQPALRVGGKDKPRPSRSAPKRDAVIEEAAKLEALGFDPSANVKTIMRKLRQRKPSISVSEKTVTDALEAKKLPG